MKKEVSRHMSSDNSFGVASVVLSIAGILGGANGIIMGIIALIFAIKQKNISKNKWSQAGLILSIIAVVLGIVSIILAIQYYLNNPELAAQFQLQ